MIDPERMKESKDYREGVSAGMFYGMIKSLSKVMELIQEEKEE